MNDALRADQCENALNDVELQRDEEQYSYEDMASLINTSCSSTLRSEQSLKEDQFNPQSPPKCLLCREVITLPQERFKPCSCENVWVHTFCALNDEKWLTKKCLRCGKILRQPPSTLEASTSTTASTVQQRMKCYICGAYSIGSKAGFRSDAVMIRPCFCNVTCHHRCIAGRVLCERQCKVCGVTYRYRKYGSLWDFFMRYRCQYCLTVSFLLILLTVSAFAITKSLSKVERFSVTRLFLLITGIAIFTTNLIFMWMCLKYTIIRRIPRFNTRYRQITVFDYDGPETSMRESIVMNGPEVNKHVVSFQHNTHCKRSHEPLLSRVLRLLIEVNKLCSRLILLRTRRKPRSDKGRFFSKASRNSLDITTPLLNSVPKYGPSVR
ncbi:hypothetical protein Q1695_011796 [Nippostrongylus brasiliensis]|nr:hypothetical protein Q1695_011796 [Nippostrongylus brasiliensis]